jgi:yecA family protein
VIWGGEESEFESEDEMRVVLGTIMGRYNEIVACLDTDHDDFDPIFLEGPEGEVIASDWAGGSLDAVALRPTAWKPLMEHDRGSILMVPLFILNGDMEIDDAADENEFMAEASDIIPTCIAGIHEFWRNYRKPPSQRGRSRSGGDRRRLH